MKQKNNLGFIGTDVLIAIVAIVIFSGLIFSLIYYHYFENVKIRKAALAGLYLTQIMENVALNPYEAITQENIDEGIIQLLPEDMDIEKYAAQIMVTTPEGLEETSEDITKKVKVTITYLLQNKKYEYTMERMKIKE